ncbi:MAG: helix-turn-helix domain-containing protein, partial [Actinobacteria bacterium]|nr:helix-turn-helix domain-containing protein [Actinomycetota bacterium]MBU4360130.1 helix-turn-helix domain-containing protein [Actinomycetota bacterium]
MIRNYKYRLYPHQGSETALRIVLEACRQLYNTSLEHRNLNYKDRKRSVNYYDQANELPLLDDPIFSLLHSQVKQDVLRRLQRSFDAFFRRLKSGNGEKPG